MAETHVTSETTTIPQEDAHTCHGDGELFSRQERSAACSPLKECLLRGMPAARSLLPFSRRRSDVAAVTKYVWRFA